MLGTEATAGDVTEPYAQHMTVFSNHDLEEPESKQDTPQLTSMPFL